MTAAAITPFLAALGILVFALDRWVRYRMARAEFEFQKRKQESEQQFREEQLEEERNLNEKRLEWLERETIRLTEVSAKLGAEISHVLRNNIDWAASALAKAKLTPHAQTLFAERMRHFQEEKEAIARYFTPLLLGRCKNLITSKKKVFIFLDSGTTLYPVFEMLGKELIKGFHNKEGWIEDLTLVTNSLSGVDSFMEHECINPSNRYSPLVVNCHFLPGEPLPIFSGVTGPDTRSALEKLRSQKDENSIFIALTTGNWIRIRRSEPLCPVPLVRGSGHCEVKKMLIDLADEVFVLSPLGKTLVCLEPGKINEFLELKEENLNPDKKPYQEMEISSEKAETVKYITTFRLGNRILSPLSTSAKVMLGEVEVHDYEIFTSLAITDVPHLFFPFDKLPDDWYMQLEEEFPHAPTRKEEILEELFLVNRPTKEPQA